MKNTRLLIVLVLLLILSILRFPNVTVEAAELGIDLWLKAIIPSLFPFMVLMQILTELDFFMILGRPLEKIMYKLFKLPGCTGFVWLSSITSGYPIGAKIIAELVNREEITLDEGQHMLHFCNNSGPLFILGTVAVSMMGIPELGFLLLGSHILSSLIIGIAYRFIMPHKKFNHSINRFYGSKGSKGDMDLGKLLGNSVMKSMEVMLLIGGFVIFFSVVIHLLKHWGFIHMSLRTIALLLRPTPINYEGVEAFIYGLVEVTNGIALLTQSHVKIQLLVALISFLVAWSGFSIHAQTASVIKGSGLKMKAYMLAKVWHGVIAGVLSYIGVSKLYPSMATVMVVSEGIKIRNSYFTNYFLISIFFILLIISVLSIYKERNAH